MRKRVRMEFHKFSFNQETKKFEIPKLRINAPKGSSLFQTSQEENEISENREKLEEKYKLMVEKLKHKSSPLQIKPCDKDDKICSKLWIAEPKPKKDTYFCCIWNDDYQSYISHITTNKHKLSSYSEDLAQIYEGIDAINKEISEEMINNLTKSQSQNQESNISDLSDHILDSPENKSSEDERMNKLESMVNNILYKKKAKEEKGK